MNHEHVPYCWQAPDFAQLTADCPPPAFYDMVYCMPRDALRALQQRRFLAQMQRAWSGYSFQDSGIDD